VNDSDKAIRILTAFAVLVVAAIAAVVSYSHIYGLGRAHGQDGTAARLLPLSVDGVILAASLVLLHEARNDRAAPRLARFMLWLGIAATIGANIAYGAGYGLPGALISAWPAVAFIGAVEMAVGLIRRARTAPEAEAEVYQPHDTVQAVADVPVPADSQSAALIALRATLAAGNPLSGRQLESRFGLTRAEATRVRELVTVESNGHLATANGSTK
jgi:uncharacterized protein DUF2637